MFTGQVQSFIAGPAGMTGTENIVLVSPEYLLDARNVTYALGGVSKEKGVSTLNAAALSGGVIAGCDYWPDIATKRTVVLCDDGSAYRDTGTWTFATTLVSGMNWTAGEVPVMITAGEETVGNDRLLMVATGTDQVQVITGDGLAFSDVTGPAADWVVGSYPKTLCLHQDRVWAALDNMLYYSDDTDHQDFVGGTSGILNVFPGTGNEIRAIASFRGTLIVWKYPYGIFVVDTTDPTVTNWSVKLLSIEVGASSPRCWAGGDNDIMFISTHGEFYAISAVQEFGDIATASISRRRNWNEWMARNVAKTYLDQAVGVYHSSNREMHFAVTGTGETKNNLRVVWDLNGNEPRPRYSDICECDTIWISKSDEGTTNLISGSSDGYVRSHDQDTYTFDGNGYASVWQTAYFDLGTAWQEKNLRWIEASYVPTGNWNCTVQLYLDGDYKYSIDMNMGSSSAVLAANVGDPGAFVLDTDTLGGAYVLNKRKRLIQSGRLVSLRITNSTAGQDYKVVRFGIGYDVGNDASR